MSAIDWEEEQKLQYFFVKTIYEMPIENPLENLIQKEKAQ
jgi:hypothetical protein